MRSLTVRAFLATLSLAYLGALVASCVPPSRRRPEPPSSMAQSPIMSPPPVTAPLPVMTETPPPATTLPPAATAAPPTSTTLPPATATATPGPRPSLRWPIGGLKLPARTPPKGKGCGEVQIDGVTIPLDCFHAAYGAMSGIPVMPAPVPPKKLVEYLDHRVSKMEGPVRHQKSVGSAVAHALASVIDQTLIRNGGGFLPVSALHLWARSPKPSLGELLQANLGKGIADEGRVPYDEAKACAWASPEASLACTRSAQGTPSAADLDHAPFARLLSLLSVDGTSGEALRDALLRDQDVLYALRVDPEAWKAVIKSADAEPLIPDYTGSTAVHTVALAGFALQDGQWYYLVKNSWGSSWGRGGYAWIQEGTLKRNFVAAFVVQASVATGPTIGPVGPHSCPPGQLPDGTTKICAPACPNGLPRKGGAC
ncbi:MAG: C1 family peptidase [Myxococcales bacterium]|nr:hypothetical protein [Polyangiaceae bacterium]MDW8248711.1 C1 family peptidase [Myxococcales bacterium]